jgi:hypothetical protein
MTFQDSETFSIWMILQKIYLNNSEEMKVGIYEDLLKNLSDFMDVSEGYLSNEMSKQSSRI